MIELELGAIIVILLAQFVYSTEAGRRAWRDLGINLRRWRGE